MKMTQKQDWPKLHIKGTLRYFMTVKVQKVACQKMIQTQIYNTLWYGKLHDEKQDGCKPLAIVARSKATPIYS